MISSRNTLDIEIGYRAPWVQLPLSPDVDAAAWSRQKAAQLARLAEEVDADFRRYVVIDEPRLMRELEGHVRFARTSEASFWFTCYPPGFGSSDIHLDVTKIYPDDGETVLTLEWFEQNFSHADARVAQIDRINLPAGPAVRIHRIFAPHKQTWWGGQQLLYNTAYAIDIPESEDLVVLNTTWTMAGLEDVITDSTDGMAETLRMTPCPR